MTYRILVKPSGFCFDVLENETILEAALKRGYFFPHHCRMAVCGTCRGKVLQGEVAYIRETILGLTETERKAGYVLFCSATPQSDLIIEVKDFGFGQLGIKDVVYDVIQTELISKNISHITLKSATDSHLFYQAGQYIKIIHPNGSASPLSIANASQNLIIELQLSHPPSNPEAHDILRFIAEEKKLIVRGPYGSCTMSVFYTEQPVIFLARGTGIAPIKAMIEEMKRFKHYPKMHVYWSVASPEEFYMDELFMQWTREMKQFSYTPVLSREHEQWRGRVGLLQNVVLEDHKDIAKYLVYVSAPEPIVHDVLHSFTTAGLPRGQYYSDIFDYNSMI